MATSGISAGSVLVVAAAAQELQDFRPDSRHGVQRLITGMGPRRAGEQVRRRLERGDIGLVVSAGFAGGVRAGFRVGDLVTASEVIEASTGRRCVPAASSFAVSWSVGPFVTVEQPLPDPEAKRRAGDRFGAIAADMESAAVAQAADRAGVAWVAVRAILDPMETSLAVRSRAQGLRMLALPRHWKEFSEFMKSMKMAGRSLGEGLNQLISTGVIPAQAGIRSSPSIESRAGFSRG